MVQDWSITLDGIEIVGKSQAGRVAMTANDEGLKIYFADSALGTARCRWEFTALIADFCGIANDPDTKTEAKSLLMLILHEGQVGEMSEILDSNGIPPLMTDVDLEEAEVRANKPNIPPRQKSKAFTEFTNPFAHLSGKYILHLVRSTQHACFRLSKQHSVFHFGRLILTTS